MVVMPDADLESAAAAFVSAAYGSSSQRCMAVSLLLAVGEGTAEKLRSLVVPKIQALHVGAYNDPKADFGAVIRRMPSESWNRRSPTASRLVPSWFSMVVAWSCREIGRAHV